MSPVSTKLQVNSLPLHLLGTLSIIWLSGKESAYNAGNMGDGVWSLGEEDTLEEERATYFSIFAWQTPWTAYGMAK